MAEDTISPVHSSVDGSLRAVESMLADFPELLETGRFTNDLQYMRVNEAKYLVIL